MVRARCSTWGWQWVCRGGTIEGEVPKEYDWTSGEGGYGKVSEIPPWNCEQKIQAVGYLRQVFRNDLIHHRDVFAAICVITQLAIENGEPLFEVHYDDMDVGV